MFSRIDPDSKKELDQDNLKWGLRNYGLEFTDDELRTLTQSFDKNGNGMFSYPCFLSKLDTFTTDLRRQCIMEFYNKMSHLLGGIVTLEGISKVYDAKRHSQVIFIAIFIQ